MTTVAHKRADQINPGERIVVHGYWSAVVDFKIGRNGEASGRPTWILIVQTTGGLREVPYFADESIAVRPPLR